jgi:Rps23 Pro-64 3,4-dihydroxylase Tpa1-like proline 4-hydroxylase
VSSVTIIKNALPLSVAHAAAAMFPETHWPFWHRYRTETSVKYGSTDPIRFPRAILAALDQLAVIGGEHFPAGVFPDYEYHAGGMHMIPPYGFLGRHLDAEQHPLRDWSRYASLVWFANEHWNCEDGGILHIEGDESEHIVTPEFNTAVLFGTKDCWHEVNKVTGTTTRKTLAVFFWKMNTIDALHESGSVPISAHFESNRPS